MKPVSIDPTYFPPIVARFVSTHVGREGCWDWTGAKEVNGYGIVGVKRQDGGKTNTTAHRAVYQYINGPLVLGMTLDHLCRNRGCCNPAHLEPLSQGDNTLRGAGPTAVNARKTHCIRGHEFTPENTWVAPSTGGRRCKECNRQRRNGPLPT